MQLEQRRPDYVNDTGPEQEEDLLDTLIQDNIEENVSVHDRQFDRGIDLYGTDYVRAYIDTVSEHMATNIVKAYAAHDLKLYEEIASHFTEVYRFLFPVSDDEASKAGNGDAYALVEHDVLDEGIDVIQEHYQLYKLTDDLLAPYDDVRYSDDRLTTEELRENSGWERVRQGYEIVENALDLPIAALFDEMWIGPFSHERTLAFKHHTAARESCDRGSRLNRESERLMRKYMKRGEISRFSALISDFDLLDDLSNLFLMAVDEHDRGEHGPNEWETNIDTMSLFYGTLLSAMVEDQYDLPGVHNIRNKYETRLSEVVPG